MAELPFADSFRNLRRHPRATTPAVLTLALGLGAATAIFALVDATLLHPLPHPEPERIVGFWGGGSWSAAELDFVRENSESYAAVGAYADGEIPMLGESPRVLPMAQLSHDALTVLRARPAQGRLFAPEHEQAGQGDVVLISDRFWRVEMGEDPEAVGKSLDLAGREREIIGILPPSFAFPSAETEVWLPLSFDRAGRRYRGSFFLSLMARLHDREPVAAALGAAHSELRALVPEMQKALDLRPDFDKLAVPPDVEPLQGLITRPARIPLLLLFAASGLLLLVACANVAHLLLAQALHRDREMAIRGALGASRRRLLGQLLAEALGIALLGGGLGLLIAIWTIDGLGKALPPGTPGIGNLALDGRVFAFGGLVSLLTVLLFGSLPALQGSRYDLRLALSEGSAGASQRRRRLRWGLVVGEMALAALLTVFAVTTVRSFLALATEDPGFATEGVVTLRPELSGDAWQERDKVLDFYARALDRTRAVPGVESAGAIWRLPIAQPGAYQVLEVEGHTPPEGQVPSVYWRAVAGDYFGTLGIPLVAGRDFDTLDSAESTPVGVINQTMAETFWPDGNAIGQRIRNSIDDEAWVTIVGVVGDVRHESLRRAAAFTLYRPFVQSPPWISRMALVARTSLEEGPALKQIEAGVRELVPTIPVHQHADFGQVMADSIARERLTGLVVTVYGSLALLLASVGIFGLLAFSIGEQRREIGIRMALGAERTRILREAILEGMIPAAIGTVIGLCAALLASRWLGSFLYGVELSDFSTHAGVAAVLLGVALAACWLPASRAAELEPVSVLRGDR